MKRLLVVVDMQNDFITGPLGTPEAQAIVASAAGKIRSYLDAGDEVVFTLDTHGEDYLKTQEGLNLPVPHCIKGTEGWSLHPALVGYPGKRFEKAAFGSTDLAHYAAAGQYGRIELIGLCTDICVISNALLLKAALPEVPVQVDAACCAGVSLQSHMAALEAMKPCQIQIV